jgi:rsbT co-antagonist protein RsbR
MSAQLPALLFPVVYGLIVSRYQYLFIGGRTIRVPAQVALRTVFDSAQEGMLICSPQGQIEQVNPAAKQLLGTRAQDTIGRSLDEVFAPLVRHQQAGEIPAFLTHPFADTAFESFDTVVHISEPVHRALAVAGHPVRDPHGRHTGCFLVLRDITEREQIQEALAAQARLAATVRALSAPIVPVAEGVLVLPLVGGIDRERARDIQKSMLQAISQHKARAILIDITGVPVVDTVVADSLVQAVRAAQLLGCQGLLVGVRAEVAQTLIGLDVDLRELVTRGSLQDGLAYATQTFKGRQSAGPAGGLGRSSRR